MMQDNTRKFNVGDTVRLKEGAKIRWLVVPCIVKYVHSIKWGWNDYTSHYVGFESEGHANWGECLFELVEKGTE